MWCLSGYPGGTKGGQNPSVWYQHGSSDVDEGHNAAPVSLSSFGSKNQQESSDYRNSQSSASDDRYDDWNGQSFDGGKTQEKTQPK